MGGNFLLKEVSAGGDITIGVTAPMGGNFLLKEVSAGGNITIGVTAPMGGNFLLKEVSAGGDITIGVTAPMGGNFLLKEVSAGGDITIGVTAPMGGNFLLKEVSAGEDITIGVRVTIAQKFRGTIFADWRFQKFWRKQFSRTNDSVSINIIRCSNISWSSIFEVRCNLQKIRKFGAVRCVWGVQKAFICIIYNYIIIYNIII